MSDLHQAKLKWPHTDAQVVLVGGDYDDWSSSTPLEKVEDGFEGIVEVPWNTKIEYKFLVDGTWKTSDDLETEADPSGRFVNNVYKSPPKPTDAAAAGGVAGALGYVGSLLWGSGGSKTDVSTKPEDGAAQPEVSAPAPASESANPQTIPAPSEETPMAVKPNVPLSSPILDESSETKHGKSVEEEAKAKAAPTIDTDTPSKPSPLVTPILDETSVPTKAPSPTTEANKQLEVPAETEAKTVPPQIAIISPTPTDKDTFHDASEATPVTATGDKPEPASDATAAATEPTVEKATAAAGEPAVEPTPATETAAPPPVPKEERTLEHLAEAGAPAAAIAAVSATSPVAASPSSTLRKKNDKPFPAGEGNITPSGTTRSVSSRSKRLSIFGGRSKDNSTTELGLGKPSTAGENGSRAASGHKRKPSFIQKVKHALHLDGKHEHEHNHNNVAEDTVKEETAVKDEAVKA